MSQTYGNTYDAGGSAVSSSGGMREDLSDILTKVNLAETPMVNLLDETEADNPVHNWPTLLVKPSVTGYGASSTPTQNAQVEGAFITMAAATPYVVYNNYTQISWIPFSISETMKNVRFAGVNNIEEDQAEVAVSRLGMDTENAYLNGVASAGSSTTARQMNGIGAWCGTAQAIQKTGSAATFATTTGNLVLETLLQGIYTNSTDRADFVLVNPTNQSAINSWTANVTKYQEADKYLLSAFISVYQSSFGKTGGVKLIMDLFMNVNTFYAGKLENFKKSYLRKPYGKKLATTGDATNRYVVLESTIEQHNPYSCGSLVIS